jgi:hypothetical protein
MAAGALTALRCVIASCAKGECAMRPAIILTALLALSACSDEKTTTVTTDDGKKATITARGDEQNGSATITGEDGEEITFSMGEAATASKLPMNMPVYPGAKVVSNISGIADGKGGAMVTMTTRDSPEKVGAFYKAEAKKRGLTSNVAESTMGGMSNFTAENASGDKLVANVTPGKDGENQVMLVIETE